MIDDPAVNWLIDEPMLHEPVLVVMLTGWIDAAGAGAAAAEAVSDGCNAAPIARFDDDTFIDFRARRPTLELRDGLNTDLSWSTIELRSGRTPDGRDVLMLLGPEPDMAWNRFGKVVADIAVDVGVTTMVGFGAYPFAAPHTRPSRLSVSSPSTDVLASVTFARSSVDVPAGMAAVLEHALHARKVPALGIWAQVPHYVSTMAYPAASVALLEGLREATGVSISSEELEREVSGLRRRLDDTVAENSEHQSMLHQLEELYDASDEPGESIDDGPSLEMRSGDDLAAEIQQFLRDQD
ncbi:MAG: PAC2 family protein [Ilumatobacteraceae bacterium]|nr:PAC2 family protein [Ilumatobacteraceae bacterium]